MRSMIVVCARALRRRRDVTLSDKATLVSARASPLPRSESASYLLMPKSPSLGHHHLHELLIVDLTIAIDICLSNHLINLLIRQLLAEVRHHMPKLGRADEAIAITVEHLESLDEFLLGVGALHLTRHERQELREIPM